MEEALGIETSKTPKKSKADKLELGSNIIGCEGKRKKEQPKQRANHSGTIKEIYDKLYNGITIPVTINFQHYNFVNSQETTFTITSAKHDEIWEKYMLENKKSMEVFGSRMSSFKVGDGEYYGGEKYSRIEITYKMNV